MMTKQPIADVLSLHPKQLFLIDSIGACLTVFMLLAVLMPLQKYIGMPPSVLRLLAVSASVFAGYSACCFWLVRTRTRWRLCLNVIAGANLFYCCLTAGLIIRYYDQLTALGVTYFALEIGVVCTLAWVERGAATRGRSVS